jgi:Flp pilus assembly protein TadG
MPTKSQRGQILPVFCLLLALLLLPVCGLAVDGGVLLSSHASLVGAAEATAEAAAQAVNVTAIDHGDAFQLCVAPDGGPSCGNGIGTVGEVVDESISAAYPGSRAPCSDYGSNGLPSALPPGDGCAFALISNCQPAATGPSPQASENGVVVMIWQTVQPPLFVFPGWTSVKLRATSTAWMEHGFGSRTVANEGPPC